MPSAPQKRSFWEAVFRKKFSIAKAGLILMLIVGINWSGLFAIGQTLAYFNDIENSPENILSAGSLDFSLDAPVNFTPKVTPTANALRTVGIINDGSLGFQYTASTTNVVGTLCASLNIIAKLDGEEEYNGLLGGFNVGSFVFDDPESWNFTVSLIGSDAGLENKSCAFDFDFDGEQSGGAGFSDIETISNLVESGTWSTPTEPGDDNISPIADSYVDQNDPNDNEGSNHDLKVRSKSGGDNRRAFIRFGFLFPTGTTIVSAALKLFLDDAPSSSRTYALARSSSSWTESGIIWDNQPATSSPITDSLSTGTINDVWLSWNVTGDVASFVAGTFSNNGWSIYDTVENSATSREGKFSSREEDHEDERPVLEVAFSAPPAPTTHLVINEVYYDVSDGKGSEGTNEWVELYNPTDAAVDVKNWQICDADLCDTLATTSPSILIPSHGFAVITPNASTWTKWALPTGAVKIVISSGSDIGNGLSNSGDAVILKNALSIDIDAMSYGDDNSQLSPSVPDGPEGTSLARIVKGYDAHLATDWIINATPNPGTNPSDSGIEIMRFTSNGILVAAHEADLPALDTKSYDDESEEEELIEEEGPSSGAALTDGNEFITSESGTLNQIEEPGEEPEENNGNPEIAEEVVEDTAENTTGGEVVTEETLPTEEPSAEIVTEEATLPEEVIQTEEQPSAEPEPPLEPSSEDPVGEQAPNGASPTGQAETAIEPESVTIPEPSQPAEAPAEETNI